MKRIKIVPVMLLIMMVNCSPPSGNESTATNDTVDPAFTENPEVVKLTTLKKQMIARTIEYSSSFIASEENHLAPSAPGRIEQIFVEVGDRVRKGDMLVQMDRTQLHQAIIQLKTVETDFMRLDTLNKVGSISKQQYDQIKAQYDIARSNVEFLRENTILSAPFDGMISGKYYEDWELYSGAPNTSVGKAAILSIVQIDPLKAIVNISEKYYPLIQTSKNAVITCDIYPDEVFPGRVLRVYPTIDPTTRSFTVEIIINNRGDRLRPGMFCRVFMSMGEEMSLVVPSLAVLKLQGSNERYVFLEENGKARRIPVTIGKRYDDMIEIISDELKEGNNLIVSGQARLTDGVPVTATADQE
jgi:membrane fusion protein (multidrug efflux system)